MKPKHFEKKLVLNKESIANLDVGQMNYAKAGVLHDSQTPTDCMTSPCGTCGTCAHCTD